MYQYLKNKRTVVNHGGVMEADIISKNGRNLKSQMSKGNKNVIGG